MALINVNAFLGWAGVIAVVLFIGGLFYVDISARRLLVRFVREDTLDSARRSAARVALAKGFRARVVWLKSMQLDLQGDASTAAQMTLRVYSWCWIALAILFALWAAAMLLTNV
jgi:hypothetical protein